MRNGKIAQLPRAIRDELNSRMDDNTPGPVLLEWLKKPRRLRSGNQAQ